MPKLKDVEDATELQVLKNKLRYLEHIVWQLPEHFYWLDLNGRVVACNENMPKLYGMTTEEFIGKNIFDLAEHMGWNVETAQKIRQNDIQVIESGKPVVADEQGNVVGGHKTFIAYKHPLYDTQNNIVGVFGMSVDITDRKKMEKDLLEQKQKAENANQAKSKFLMNLGHDIRTPFSGIIGNADILLHLETDEKKREILNDIIDSSRYLLDLLNDTIDIVDRDDAQEAPLTLQPVELAGSINTIVKLMQPQAQQKQLTMRVNLPNNLPKTILSHSKSLERILLNLIGNAIKFTKTGGIEVNVECLQDKENLTVKIFVKDTGIGIPQDQIDALLNQNTISTPTYNENYQRCGLGLNIVKHLVSQLKGKIEVESKPHQGTTFQITLHCPPQPFSSNIQNEKASILI